MQLFVGFWHRDMADPKGNGPQSLAFLENNKRMRRGAILIYFPSSMDASSQHT